MTRTYTLLALTSLLTLTMPACGTGAAEPPAPPAAPAGGPAPTAAATGAPASKCQFEVTGDLTARVSATAKRMGDPHLSAGSDYWLTDDDLRSAIKTMTNLWSKKSAEEKAREIEAGMAKDPRMVVLLMSCGTDSGGSLILGSGASRYADVPFGPGTYEIAASSQAGKPFSPMFSLKQDGKHYFFKLTEPGTLAIARFDATGLAGTFAFKAKADGKSVAVTGSFEYACAGSKCRP